MRAILLAATLVAAPAPAQVALEPGETLLQVEASGTARVRPDIALVTMGVVSTGTTAREATDGNARAMAAVIAAVRGAGVGEREIRTRQISVQPRFAQGTGGYDVQARIVGYVARNNVGVTIRKLATAPEVIAAGFGAGANSVEGPSLGTDDPDLGVADARRDALARAKAEAEGYAAGLGLRVGRVLRVSERANSMRDSSDIIVTANRSYAGAPPPPAPPPPTPFSGGELMRKTTVWIDYALSVRAPGGN